MQNVVGTHSGHSDYCLNETIVTHSQTIVTKKQEAASTVIGTCFHCRHTWNVSFRGADFNITTNPSLCLVSSRRKKTAVRDLNTAHHRSPLGSSTQ